MRRTRESGQKLKKFMIYLMGFIMVGSVFGVVFFGFGTSGSSSIEYNDFKFVGRGSFWSTIVDDREAMFTYFPSDVEIVLIDEDIISRLKDRVQIDATSDFNDTFAESIALAQYQIGITLNNFNVFVRKGFTSEQQTFPIITCNQSTTFVPVIYFKSSNETRVYLENDCIIAEALNQEDIIRIRDRLVYGILGII
jgi:hypothetical protein